MSSPLASSSPSPSNAPAMEASSSESNAIVSSTSRTTTQPPPPTSTASSSSLTAGGSQSTSLTGGTSTTEDPFLERLKLPEAAPLTYELKAFIANLRSQQRTIAEKRKAVMRFMETIYAETLQNPIFANVQTDAEVEMIREGWEKLLMLKIYESVFGGPGTDERKMTAHLNSKIQAFNWIEERHFDLPFVMEPALGVAKAELLKLNTFRCPKDKLTILKNVIQIIVDIIKKLDSTANNDHLLPALILVIIRSNPPDLISHMNFILRFRAKADLEKGNVQFCMTSMMSAISFIYNMTLSSLTLTPEEVDKYNKTLSPQHKAAVASRSSSSSSSQNVGPSSGTLATTAASTATAAATKINDIASTMFTSTLKVFGDTAAVIRSAAESAAGTVDGFTQGLMDRFREDAATHGQQAGGAAKGPGTAGPWQTQKSQSASRVVEGKLIDMDDTSPTAAPGSTKKVQFSSNSSATGLDANASGSEPLVPLPFRTPANGARGGMPSSDRFSSAHDRAVFEAALSDAERGILLDYDLQLALALSLSIEQGGEGSVAGSGEGNKAGSQTIMDDSNDPLLEQALKASLAESRPSRKASDNNGSTGTLIDIVGGAPPPSGLQGYVIGGGNGSTGNVRSTSISPTRGSGVGLFSNSDTRSARSAGGSPTRSTSLSNRLAGLSPTRGSGSVGGLSPTRGSGSGSLNGSSRGLVVADDDEDEVPLVKPKRGPRSGASSPTKD
ncbi:hypothetical protein HDU76_002713 [Blyttiomyces sp. JEL0837]|nr:hypothetical protein HDU76_002713 [Blyttiomyces sp. JEL0837]